MHEFLFLNFLKAILIQLVVSTVPGGWKSAFLEIPSRVWVRKHVGLCRIILTSADGCARRQMVKELMENFTSPLWKYWCCSKGWNIMNVSF